MQNYDHKKIEKKWQELWKQQSIYKLKKEVFKKPKYYVLDMFPYPSGAGLHVGHPLGYVASDIIARYKTLCGYNVLHPMGFDSFGLPAEQYAIQTGTHPAITTQNNIKKYREQLDKLGFNYDWGKKIETSDPDYYKWTQWIFIQLFNSWYDNKLDKARPIEELIKIFEFQGNRELDAVVNKKIQFFSSHEWNNFSEDEKYKILLSYRLAYLSDIDVNWCPELGTVLANEEVKDGFSERGGYPVIKKKMRQWCLKITAYAERLLLDLDKIDWSKSIKETQKNWIGKSNGLEVEFEIYDSDLKIKIFTTRPDTIFGTTYVALAPEHPILKKLDLTQEIKKHIEEASNRSELDRNKDQEVNGIFSGYSVIHPFTKELIPIWIADYVLIGYGTGAVLAVPAHDTRDFNFAKHYGLPIINVIEDSDLTKGANISKNGKIINSSFLDGLKVDKAIEKIIEESKKRNIGKDKINYKLRDAIFSRQRYWGEPFPIYYKNNMPYILKKNELPLKLPSINNFKPTINGDPPLGNAKNWKTIDGYPYEINTMPGWAGSSWYFLRFMDNENDHEFVNTEKQEYWKKVDLYIGGSEHATGHLIYSRFWTKFLYDLKYISIDEPFKKMINQGMIQGISKFVYKIKDKNIFVSYNLRKKYDTIKLHVDINLVKNNFLNIENFKKWREEYNNSEFILEDGKYICGSEMEKMSKSKYNTISPDEIVDKYGADSLRLYSMFLGPLEHSKPWNLENIEGISRFLSKLWKFFLNIDNNASKEIIKNMESLKSINKLIKNIKTDLERYSFNTCISHFMICLNELLSVKNIHISILKEYLICLSPFAPFITEELWHHLGHKGSIHLTNFPDYDIKYLIEKNYEYPISINGKTKFKMSFPVDMKEDELKKSILKTKKVVNLLKNTHPKKIIAIHKKIINIVL